MYKCPSAIALGILACSAYAQEDASNIPPSETVGMVWVILFGLLFVGMIAGFFGYLWWTEKKRKSDG